MATRHARGLARIAVAPSVLVLFLWMIVPLGMTLYFSVLHYDLLDPGNEPFIGFLNYRYFLTDPAFFAALGNTLKLVGAVLAITVVGGILLALLLDQPFLGRGIVRLMVIAPFFVMPTVSALIWKNLLMHPVSGLFAWIARSVGLQPIDWFAQAPLTAISLIVAWQWLPFATLILLTALQSQDGRDVIFVFQNGRAESRWVASMAGLQQSYPVRSRLPFDGVRMRGGGRWQATSSAIGVTGSAIPTGSRARCPRPIARSTF